MKKNYKKLLRANNAIDPANTTARNWGFHPIPSKGGATTNYDDALPDQVVRVMIRGRKAGGANA